MMIGLGLNLAAVAGRGTAPRAVPGYITMLGSSTTDNDSDFSTGTNTFKFNAEGPLSWCMRISKQRFGYIRDMRSSLQYHFGFAGLTTRQLIDNGHALACATATAACGGVAYLQILRNDVAAEVASATCLERAEEVCDIFDAAGAKYILCEDYPRLASETNAANKLAIREANNAGLAAIAAAHGVGLALWGDLGEDPGDPGYVRTDWVNASGDPGHPLPPLAYLMGKELWRVHQEKFAVPDAPDLSALIVHASNILPNSVLDTGGAAQAPTGYTVNNISSATHTKGNKIAYDDGSGAFKFPITAIEPGSPTTGAGTRLTRSSDISTGWAEGDIVEAVVEAFTPSDTDWKGGAISVGAIFASSFWEPRDGPTSYTPAAPPAAIERPADSIVLRSMPIAIPASQTVINWRAFFAGSGYHEWGKPALLINHGNAILPAHFEYP